MLDFKVLNIHICIVTQIRCGPSSPNFFILFDILLINKYFERSVWHKITKGKDVIIIFLYEYYRTIGNKIMYGICNQLSFRYDIITVSCFQACNLLFKQKNVSLSNLLQCRVCFNTKNFKRIGRQQYLLHVFTSTLHYLKQLQYCLQVLHFAKN